MLARPFNHPMNWFPYDVTGSMELLDAYVSDIERQVQKGIVDFGTLAEQVTVESGHPDEQGKVVIVHQGLDDETWDLRAIFHEYFPGLQRRSALITLFSFFEHELNKLCSLFQTTEGFKLSLRDVAGSGIERARTYLYKVASLDLDQPAAHWNEIRNIQSIRNVLVHVDGRLRSQEGVDRTALRRYLDACEYLGGETEVIIRAGYLKHVLGAFGDYFSQVHGAIRTRYGA